MWANTILILGAGRSSGSLIDYLLKIGSTNNWQIVVGDVDVKAAVRLLESIYRRMIAFLDVN